MKKKILIGLAIVIVIAAIIALNMAGANKSTNGLPVNTVEASKQDIISQVSTSGVVEEQESSIIYAEGDLRVEKIHVRVGDRVKKGDLLADVDLKDLQNQVEQARINLEMERLNLQKLQGKDTLQDPRQVELDVKEAQIAFEKSENDYARNQVLYEQKAISQVELNEVKIKMDNASLNLQRAKNRLENIKKDNQKAQLELQNEIAIQKNNVRLADIRLERLEEQLDRQNGKIISPIDGVVTKLDTINGQFMEAGMAIFTIADTGSLIIKVNVSEYDIGKVKVGQEAEITGNGLDNTKEHKAKVRSIASTAAKVRLGNAEETAVEVILEILNPSDDIKTGFSIDAKIITRQEKEAIVIPYEAIQNGEDGKKFVYVIDEGIAKKIEIKTGVEADLFVQVEEGIKEGDKLIVNPTDKISDGTAVKEINQSGNKKGV
ncbi:efflux RND transporter periplasmic adaptor subunit [Petroclostridium sp. X23]|uniref:efflux RND transporter periplasmic adaptor subunit n=1 Tax=Petroclostridium sp. X23 TaxID=3045146 RepID=UPI0024ADBF51|nr:efflux RND transporter periplasmic adaptor subunit [Petroclostridium sp. X23]WHH59292.1 efflux RND transporter periplasmic adaptor subunit [Petroclostridium sp. X23]